jgi:purine-binding chemotaxis protein CheW
MDNNTMSQVYLSFLICNELFAVSVFKVLEVLQKQTITNVPNAPEYISGIINFRGEVVPVFDTRVKFNRKSRNENDPFVIIVLDLANENESLLRIGAIVDSVRDVITFSNTDIKPMPPMDNKFDTSFINGVVKLNDHFILLLNIDKMFTNSEVNDLAETLNTSSYLNNCKPE